MRARVSERQLRAVGDAEQRQLARADGLPDRLHVGDRVGRRVERPPRAEPLGALLPRRGRAQPAVALHLAAAQQPAAACAALVEADHRVAARQLRELEQHVDHLEHAGAARAAR
jgi:hypothetical protein